MDAHKHLRPNEQLFEPVSRLDDLVDGQHERCAFCRKRFPLVGGKMVRHHALDGKWYCDSVCASASYLKRGWSGL